MSCAGCRNVNRPSGSLAVPAERRGRAMTGTTMRALWEPIKASTAPCTQREPLRESEVLGLLGQLCRRLLLLGRQAGRCRLPVLAWRPEA
jgi:hypothetical protein